MPIANGIVYGKDTRNDYNDISSYAQNAHDVMTNAFTESNILYSKSSVIEDIVLNKFLSIYNTAKAINFSNILRKNYIFESFTSQDYVDLKFPVDNLLNLDIQNGSLTLPVNQTRTLISDSIIIESESNGQPGNSYAYDNSNADPKVILTADNATLFEYEKVSNIFSATTLYFSCTIKLQQEEVANGCYLRLYSDDGNNYALVDTVDISLDGKDWYNVNKTIDINKADHYIRFMPRKIRFIRVRLKQDTYNVVKTALGPKYRYVIGIREISAKQTSYKTSGEYISIPFASRKIINGVAFNSDEISFNDISYYVSANNGAKWVQIKNAQSLDLNSEDMGMRGEIDITQIRVKIKMDRVRSPNASYLKEYIVTNTTDQYFLKYKPISIEAHLGNHVSYGTTKPYSFFISSTSNVDPNVLVSAACMQAGATVSQTLFYIPYRETMADEIELRIMGALMKNDRATYSFMPHANPEHSIIVMRADILSGAQSANIDLTYAPFLYDHRYTKVTGSSIELPQNAFVESPEGITIEQISFIKIPIGAQGVDFNLFDSDSTTVYEKTLTNGETEWTIEAANSEPFVLKSYSVTPSVDSTDGSIYNMGKWTIYGSNDDQLPIGQWVKLDEQDKTSAFWLGSEPREFTLGNSCAFAYYRIVVQTNCADSGQSQNTSILKINNINFFDSKSSKIVDQTLYSIIPHTTTSNTVVMLSDSIYNPECDYKITYMPSVALSSYMPQTWKDNGISLQSLHTPPVGSKICFEYSYEDSETIRDIDYYTPVCHEYRVELI